MGNTSLRSIHTLKGEGRVRVSIVFPLSGNHGIDKIYGHQQQPHHISLLSKIVQEIFPK
jgi:hypothetical protein